MAKRINMIKHDLKLLVEQEEKNFSFHGAISNYDHWLTEEEAEEKIYLYDTNSQDKQQKYLIEEEKFIHFFENLASTCDHIFCFDSVNLNKIYVFKDSQTLFFEEIKKGLREQKTQRIIITNMDYSFKIIICYDLTMIFGSNFPIVGSFIQYAIENSGLYIL
jgi:hypothetical protein